VLSRYSNWIAVVWIIEMAGDFKIMQNHNFTYCFIQIWILVCLPTEQSTELSIWRGRNRGLEEKRKFNTKQAYNLYVPHQGERAGHVIHVGKNASKILVNLKLRGYWRDLSINQRITLTWILLIYTLDSSVLQ